MATTVNNAFREFLANQVNLDPTQVGIARSSRDWLLQQIQLMPSRNTGVPPLYTDIDMHYGSFARRTKIRELDDIDIIIGVKALGVTYSDQNGVVVLRVPDGNELKKMCHMGTDLLNSRKLIEYIIGYLDKIPQYNEAHTKRNGSAAVLSLKSYTWVFDIVPAFLTSPEFDGRNYYLIPDGNGNWMKTDPRIDKVQVSSTNQNNDGNVLNPLRLIKYWNARATMPKVQSYTLETIVLNYYSRGYGKCSKYPDLEMASLMDYIASAIMYNVNDPKNIEGNINRTSYEDRLKVSKKATSDAEYARAARKAEDSGDHKEAIRLWGRIFGSQFPVYG
jgi:hypothetical protein